MGALARGDGRTRARSHQCLGQAITRRVCGPESRRACAVSYYIALIFSSTNLHSTHTLVVNMSTPSISLKIAPFPERQLPDSVPNLMPFHIAYTGPAPMSTYFRVKTAPEPTYGQEVRLPKPLVSADVQESMDSQATLVEEPEPTPGVGSSSSATTLASSATSPDVMMRDEATGASTSGASHFVASFRGREIRGTKVDLPEGYAGIVLRAPDETKGKGVDSRRKERDEEKPNTKRRVTRRAKRAQEVIEVQDEDDAMDTQGAAPPSDEDPVRVLQPVSTFSSFVLWHPDNPVDPGRDEYMRSLKEWTRLAAEVRELPFCVPVGG